VHQPRIAQRMEIVIRIIILVRSVSSKLPPRISTVLLATVLRGRDAHRATQPRVVAVFVMSPPYPPHHKMEPVLLQLSCVRNKVTALAAKFV
jgi:hypothetical protein